MKEFEMVYKIIKNAYENDQGKMTDSIKTLAKKLKENGNNEEADLFLI